jgi:uncharacterized surface protein with fasciclin (FAS1) repeats
MEGYVQMVIQYSLQHVCITTIFLFFALPASAIDAVAIDKPLHTDGSEIIKSSNKSLSISAFMEEDERLTLFTTALKSSSVWQHLNNNNTTLFVTTNEALRTEGSAFLLDVVLTKKENEERLNQLMAYHLVPNRVASIAELSKISMLASIGEDCIPITAAGGSIRVGPEAFVTESISAKNGNIYFIDRLLWQPYLDDHHCDSLEHNK